MTVTVRLHGEPSRYLGAGSDRAELQVGEGATVHSVLSGLGLPEREYWLVAINGQVARPHDTLHDGDVLECVAPMSGG